MAAAAAIPWDFEPRSVAFTATVRATFHPSVGAATIALPWLDASGAAAGAPVVLGGGPLEGGEPDASRGGRCANRPGALKVRLEHQLGALPVTLELVQALRSATLPLTVALPGASGPVEVAGSARVHLGPLLLAGGAPPPADGEAGEGDETASQGTQPAVWTSQDHAQSVQAVLTDTVGLAGLYSLEVVISTDMPILSRPMLRRLLPVCFTLEAVRGLPNEPELHEKCEDVHLQVYPELSRVTGALGDVLPHLRTVSRPHAAAARFSEPVVWFLGLVPPHIAREWLQHEGIAVEVHDRDLVAAPSSSGAARASLGGGSGGGEEEAAAAEAGGPEEQEDLTVLLDRHGSHSDAVKRKPHPHGVARFQFGQLLESQSLQVNMRAAVVPCRSDKKRERAQAMKNGLSTKGLIDGPEGAAEVARRSGMDKREDTTDYHARGCVLTLRASMALPLPNAKKIEDREHGQRQEQWAAGEQRDGEEGNIFVAACVEEPDPSGQPRQLPFRAKLALADGSEVAGPWRKSREHAEEDERQLLAASEQTPDAAEGDEAEPHAATRELHTELHKQPPQGLDCRFERFGRLVLVVDETELGVIRTVLQHVLSWNSRIKGIDPGTAEATTYQLTAEERADPHLDVLTGFAVLDGKRRIIVLEGLREQEGLKTLAMLVGHTERQNTSAFKLLFNSDVGFSQRLYADFAGLALKQIKLRKSLEALAEKPGNYAIDGLVATDTFEAIQAVKLLMELKQMKRLHAMRKGSAFPKMPHLTNLQILYGGFLSDAELEGRAPSSPPSPVPAGKAGARGGLATSAMAESRSLVDFQAVATLKLGASAPLDATDGAKLAKSRRKGTTDHQNRSFEESRKLRTSASAPDFTKTNRKLVQQQSEERVRLNDSLGKVRHREAPFLEGEEVYLYSTQRLNCCEKQKAWMREKMDQEASTKVWTYSEEYLSQDFDFSGASPPGKAQQKPLRKNDSYANVEGDDRQPWRATPAREKEAFRKPPRDVSKMRSEDLHEPFAENEWQKLPVCEDRQKPVAVHVHYDPDKLPHNRRITERPFDRGQIQVCGRDFGPKDMWESVHYHGRAPGEHVHEEAERHHIREREKANSKILAGKEMRTFTQGATRSCISDVDRYEQVLKDTPSRRLRGRLDDPMPVGIRHQEPYHEIGNPAKEWQARLRENDSSPPFEVSTGTYLPRDPDVGTGMKRSMTSGTLRKAPWRHGAASFDETKDVGGYVSAKDFDSSARRPGKKHDESQVWKRPSRVAIQDHERKKVTYQRPVDYGIPAQFLS